jgi:hypothetical protein
MRYPAISLVVIAIVSAILPTARAGNPFAKQSPTGDVGFLGKVGPPGRFGHAAVVTDDSEMFIFGGQAASSNGDFLNDMWMYDWNTGIWVAHSLNELLCDQCSTCQNDNSTCYDWTGLRPYSQPLLLEGKNRQIREVPSGRQGHSLSIVLNRETGERDTFVLYGGESIDCNDYCDDLWHYNYKNKLWSKKAEADYTKDRPIRRWKHATAEYYDAVFMFGGHSQRLLQTSATGTIAAEDQYYYDTDVVYNGDSPLFMDDIWVYNATEREWEFLVPTCTTCDSSQTEADGTANRDLTGPRGRISPTLVTYEGSLYLFGGYAYGGQSNFVSLYPVGNATQYPSLESKYFLNDIWKYDILSNSWTELFPVTGYEARPDPRFGHSATVVLKGTDVIMLIHGGKTWDDEIGDMWQYNVSSNVWSLLQGEGDFPSRRYGATMVAVGQASALRSGASGQSGRTLIFGGHGCLYGVYYADATQAAVDATTQGRTYVDPVTGSAVEWSSKYSMTSDGYLQVNGVSVVGADDSTWLAATDATIQAANGYGEVICTEWLDDLWQYLPDECPNDCSRSGTCSFNVCQCIDGFFGDDCSQPLCPNSNCTFDAIGRTMVCDHCSGRGDCVDGACVNCEYPSSGTSCENDVGLCTTCECYETAGVTPPEGLDCGVVLVCPRNPSIATSAECAGNGECVSGVCQCYPGFTDSMVVTRAGDARIPARLDVNGTVLPAPECGYDDDPTAASKFNSLLITDACEPIYIADCGGYLYQLAGSERTRILVSFIFALLTFELVIA